MHTSTYSCIFLLHSFLLFQFVQLVQILWYCKYEYFKVKTINELRHAAHNNWSSTGRLPKIVPNVKVAAELIILKGYLGQKFLQNNP